MDVVLIALEMLINSDSPPISTGHRYWQQIHLCPGTTTCLQASYVETYIIWCIVPEGVAKYP